MRWFTGVHLPVRCEAEKRLLLKRVPKKKHVKLLCDIMDFDVVSLQQTPASAVSICGDEVYL